MSADPEIMAVLKEYMMRHPAFRSKPIGAPNSTARADQDAAINLENRAVVAIAKAKGAI